MWNESSIELCGWSADELKKLLNGKWYGNPPPEGWIAQNFATTEKGAVNNTIFIARTRKDKKTSSIIDTHTLIHKLIKRISGAIVQKPIDGLPKDFPQLIVENSFYNIINNLAIATRERFTGKLIAVTGTVGKSTTKEMLSHLIKNERSLIATKGNNNTIKGVPLTMMSCINSPDMCVLEVAAPNMWNKSRNIGRIIRPHICIITQIGIDSVDQLKNEHMTAYYKAKICDGIVEGGFAVLNAGMNEFDYVREEVIKYGAKPIIYGLTNSSDSYLINSIFDGSHTLVKANILGNEVSYKLAVLGEGLILNSIAALTALALLNFDINYISQKFVNYIGNKSVLQITKIKTDSDDITILDDSHNATKLSMLHAFNTFDEFVESSERVRGRKVAILGRIALLYQKAPEVHVQLAEPLLNIGIEKIFFFGDEMRYLTERMPEDMIGGLYDDIQDCVNAAVNYIRPGDYILIKGSRTGNDFYKISKLIIDRLKKHYNYVSGFDNIDEKLEIESNSAILIDASTGITLYEQNSHERFQPASLTKIMTLLLIYDAIEKGKISYKDVVTVSEKAVSVKGQRIFLKLNEKLSVEVLIKCIAIVSANDATIAMAEFICGNEEKFVTQMNKKAVELGMSGTVFKTASGLPKIDQLSTASDIALVSRELISKYPQSLKLLKKQQDIFIHENEDIVLKSSNKLLSLYPASTGLKTGFSKKSLYCLAASAEKNDMKLVGIVLGSPNSDVRFQDVIKMFDFGFSKLYYENQTNKL